MKKEYLIYKLSEEMKEATRIDTELFSKFDVKRGLRNEDGTGVLVGLTRIGNVVGNLGYVAVAVTGSMLAVAGSITVGDIQAFIQYVRSFTQPITQIAQVFNMLQSMAAAG